MNDRLPAVEPNARDLIAAVRALVKQIRGDTLRMEMQPTDAEKGLHAVATLEALFPGKLASLVAAHDALGAALNAACPDADPVISMTTELPA